MSSASAATAAAAALDRDDAINEELERVNQSITRKLQEIDADFSQATEVATTILSQVRQYGAHMHEASKALGVWATFFNGFYNEEEMAVALSESKDSFSNNSLLLQAQERRKEGGGKHNTSAFSSQSTPVRLQRNAINTPPFHSPSFSLSFTQRTPPTPRMSSPPKTTPFHRHPPTQGGAAATPAGSDAGSDAHNSSIPSMPSFSSPPNSTPFLAKSRSPGAHKRKSAGGEEWPRFRIEEPHDVSAIHVSHTPATRKTRRTVEHREEEEEDCEVSMGSYGGGGGDDSLMNDTPKKEGEGVMTHDASVLFSPVHRKPFALSLFPSVYRQGAGAQQLTDMHGFIFGTLGGARAVALGDVSAALPALGEARALLLLDILTSRGFLKPVTDKQTRTKTWQPLHLRTQ